MVRIIAGVPPRTHSRPLFNELGILPLEKLHEYHVGLLMYKFHNNMLPIVFDVMFTRNSDVHSHNTRQRNLMRVPLYTSELGQNSFKYQAVKIWNLIRQNMDIDIKISTFKLHLKRYLFV